MRRGLADLTLLLRVQRPTSIECKACLGLLQSAPAAFERVGGLCRYHAHCGRSGFLLRRDIGSAATVCCISGTSFLGDSFVYGSLGVALATV